MTVNAPIKRHDSLVPFSRDHHFGLLLVWKIKQGLNRQVDPVRISNYVRYYFQGDIFPHFKEEETHLFSMLENDDPLRLRAEEEHTNLRNLLKQLENDAANTNLLVEIARSLAEHIRFEERELFDYMQKIVSADQLQLIHSHEGKESRDADSKWDDHFWVTEKNVMQVRD